MDPVLRLKFLLGLHLFAQLSPEPDVFGNVECEWHKDKKKGKKPRSPKGEVAYPKSSREGNQKGVPRLLPFRQGGIKASSYRAEHGLFNRFIYIIIYFFYLKAPDIGTWTIIAGHSCLT